MHRWLLRASFLALPLMTGCLQQPVEPEASAPSLALRGAGGATNLAVGGTGLYTQPSSFSVDVSAASSDDILSAAFYWSGRGNTSAGDDTIVINGTEYTGTLLDSYELPSGTPWVFFYKLDAKAVGLVSPGMNNYMVSGFELDSERRDGIGFAAVYNDDDSPWESVMVLEPNEFIYWGWDFVGMDRTSVLGFPLSMSEEERTGNLTIFVTDCEDSRTDAIYWQTGMFPPPTDLVGTGNVLENQFFSNAGPEIDIYQRDGLVIPAGAEYFAYQLYSPQPGNGDSMAHLFSAFCVSRPDTEDPLACRVTGGGNTTNEPIWDGTFAKGRNGRGGEFNRYQFGGQAGAPTADQPQPRGEWTHHQHGGPDGRFIFHAGTSSAPEGTEIDRIVCSDPGWCVQARPAPAKQIDFEGVGTFRNIRFPSAPLEHVVPGETFHWFEVHIEDLGEPGGHSAPEDDICPPEGSSGGEANCDCPDFYRMTIYQGVAAGEAPNKTDVIYDVYGYIESGNLQIHPPVGGGN